MIRAHALIEKGLRPLNGIGPNVYNIRAHALIEKGLRRRRAILRSLPVAFEPTP